MNYSSWKVIYMGCISFFAGRKEPQQQQPSMLISRNSVRRNQLEKTLRSQLEKLEMEKTLRSQLENTVRRSQLEKTSPSVSRSQLENRIRARRARLSAGRSLGETGSRQIKASQLNDFLRVTPRQLQKLMGKSRIRKTTAPPGTDPEKAAYLQDYQQLLERKVEDLR